MENLPCDIINLLSTFVCIYSILIFENNLI